MRRIRTYVIWSVSGVLGIVVVGLTILVAASWAPDRPVSSLTARWAPPPSQFIRIDGMNVHYRDEGVASDPVPIVLLHGTGASLHTWEGWVVRLKDQHRIISFDRPGFGLTGPNPSGDYGLESSAAFTVQLLDRLGVRQCILVGNSSGGRVALHVAQLVPERVTGLVLIDSAGYARTTPLPPALRMAQSRFASYLMSYILPRSAVEDGIRGTYGDPSKVTAALVDRNYEIALRQGNRRALGATLRAQAYGDDTSLVRNLRIPTLILWGGRDTVMSPSDPQRFHHDILGSVLKVFPTLGHIPQEEDPEATSAALQQWLAR